MRQAAGQDSPARPATPAGRGPGPASLRRYRLPLAALAIIAAGLCVKAVILDSAFFRQDDFEYVARAMEADLDFDYLMRVHSGHLMPIGFSLAWALTHLDPYNWGLYGAVTLALHAAAGLALFRLLRLLFGDRPAILAPLAVYALSPMTVASTAWWAAALNSLPLQIALPMAAASHVLYLRDGRFRHVWAAAAWTAVGVFAFLKAAVIPLLLFLLTWLYLTHSTRGIAFVSAVRDHARAWLVHLGVLAAFGAAYLARLSTSDVTPRPPDWGEAARWVRDMLTETFASTAAGGPGRWHPLGASDYAVVDPPAQLLWASWAVLAALVVVSLLYRRGAWTAWTILLTYVVLADLVPVLAGRIGAHASAWSLGQESRYVADAAPVLALCVALALLPLRDEPHPYRRPLPAGTAAPVLGGLVLGAFGAHALWSSMSYAETVDARPVRTYFENARASLRQLPPGAEVLDTALPPDVQWWIFKDYSRTGHVLNPLAPERLRGAVLRPGPAERPMIFDGKGRLRPAGVWGPTAVPPPPGCWPATGDLVTVPLPQATAGRGRPYAVEINYLAPRDVLGRVRHGGAPVDVTFRQGLNVVTVPLRGGGADVQVTLTDPNAKVCVTKVKAGLPVPRR
ncbi:MAG: hypothetical protein GEV11_21325 [Streptosporangiales bacterium]|nr:hypothetical protein [Streptosporangiales bacterium]